MTLGGAEASIAGTDGHVCEVQLLVQAMRGIEVRVVGSREGQGMKSLSLGRKGCWSALRCHCC